MATCTIDMGFETVCDPQVGAWLGVRVGGRQPTAEGLQCGPLLPPPPKAPRACCCTSLCCVISRPASYLTC